MNLNKPPISEEQTALEEYVDFLLTDRSNVTPIHRKISLARILNEKKRENTHESVGEIIGLNLKTIEKESSIDKEPNIDKGITINEKNDLVQKADLNKEINKKYQDKIESNETNLNQKPSIIPSIETPIEKPKSNERTSLSRQIELSEQTVLLDKALQNDKASTQKTHRREFVKESEEDELKKWDKILTKEKEQNFLALETAIIISDRPPIFDDVLPHKEPDHRLASVEKLLSRISLATKPVEKIQEEINTELNTELSSENELFVNEPINQISEESVQATFLQRASLKTKDMLPAVFQTLIFNVGKLPLAVPLLKLGGIVHISEKEDITPLVGTPDWFMGLVPHERGNLMVIDTQKYLMPEKSIGELSRKPYEYLIILDDSNWAIACHSVGEAKNLTLDDIRWSAKSSKRPWFGGMVVQYMSAIIEVDELINMLASNIVD